MTIRVAVTGDLDRLAALAAATFPLAAPDDAAPESLAEFIELNLSAARFAEYLDAPDHEVLVNEEGDLITGYAMLVDGEPVDPDVLGALSIRPTIALSKFYVSPDAHGLGVANRLMVAAFHAAERRGAAAMWLGVNQENLRAQRFYARHGFEQVGTKRFQVGARLEHDFVLERRLRFRL